ncbi:hypothetical protein HPB48_000441 [Haemaphysalis longicornis]|uniref:C2H2-type domain-containing protein n=1 Tax=Haemaphysalis longicornis TaxID=44386 RepID=A0A9J6F9L0_HAELO|nr:hypothetical protein HPB48_000441 [Haemaphysalis longicornis]
MKVKYCPRCPFYSHQFIKVVTHIGLAHSAEPNFRVFCGIGGCANSYRNFSSYKSHLYRCHRSFLEENGSHLQPQPSEPRCSADHAEPLTDDRPQPVDELCSDGGDCQNPGTSRDRSPHHFTETRRNDFATFLQEAKSAVWNFFFHATEQHDLPHSAVERLFLKLQLVFEEVMKAYAGQIAQAVKAPETDKELEQLLECSFVPELFKGIDKKHAGEQYVKEAFPFVEPEEHVMGLNAKFHYVPLPKLLSVLCNIPDIAAHLATPQVEEDAPRILKDYTDGLIYRKHLRALLPEGSAHTILILLYTDEIDVVNPLGAKRGIHKLLAVYCSLLNIHPKYRWQFHSTYLVMLVKYVHVQSYRLDTVLQPVVDDLRQLSDQGLRFNFEGAEKHARVLLFSFCGDNLSMNRLGGFSCGFSGGRVCRFCMVSAKQLASKTSEHMCQLRTAARHRVHLQAVAVNSKANKRLYGVKETSVLLQLPYFDVTRQLPPDIMHDMLEGGAECVLRQVLRSLMEMGFPLQARPGCSVII